MLKKRLLPMSPLLARMLPHKPPSASLKRYIQAQASRAEARERLFFCLGELPDNAAVATALGSLGTLVL
jgi:hypothetical protein